MALNVLFVCMLTISMVFSFIYTGERPIYQRLVQKIAKQGTITLPAEHLNESEDRVTHTQGPNKSEIPSRGKVQVVEENS